MATRDDHGGVVGRDAELRCIARCVEAVPAGPVALVIQGEAGIGKTTLWHEAVDAARRASYAVISCRPTEAEAGLPYVGLGDLFADVPSHVLSELQSPQRTALELALLRTTEEGPPLHRRAVSTAVLNTLLIWSRSTPMLVAIDDLQWLDAPSTRALKFAIRRIDRAPIGFVAAIRDGCSDQDPLGFGAAFGTDGVELLRVAPLCGEALDLLLRSHLHTTLLRAALRRVEVTSGGNPFFAIELGRAMLDPETSTEPGEPLLAPSSLTSLLAARLARLSSGVREVVLVAAALAHPTVDVVRAATAGSQTPATAALDQAEESGLITWRDGLVRFTHPLLASVIYSQASAPQRRRLHARLAGLVVDPDERARHLALGVEPPDATVASVIDEAAGRAARRGAPDAAAALLEEAARLTPTEAVHEVNRRKLNAVDQHIAAGETARALALVQEVVAISGEGPTRARALHRLGTIRLREGAFAAARAPLIQSLGEAGENLALRASIERDLGAVLIQDGSISEALSHARAGLQAAEASGSPVLLAEALDHICMTEFLCGNGIDEALLERAIALDDQVGPAPLLDHPGPGTGRFPLALTLKWTDRFDAARTLLHSLRDEHSERGDEGPLAAVLFHLGELELWAGDWASADRLAGQARELASRTGQAGAEARALNLEAMLEACRGNAEAARAKGTASLVLAENAHDYLARIRSLKALGLLELSMDHHEDAVQYMEHGLELETAAGYDPSVVRLVPDVIEAYVTAGRVEDARQLADDFVMYGRRSGGPWSLATGARCVGLVAAAAGDVPGARDCLEQALVEHERLPQPFELARTLLALGNVERRAKKKSDARQSLGEARQFFETLGARLWADRTRAELARIGGRAPSPLELTPTEQRVAELVLEGGTNREIAAAMLLSEKTIESNLTHIYRKLGLDSRRQLARWMRAEQDRPRR